MRIRRAAYLMAVVGLTFFLGACSSDDDSPSSPSGGGGGGGTGQAPVITKVTWMQTPGCAQGVRSPVTIQVTVTDADTDLSMLTYSGSVSSCSGAIDSDSVQVSCPQLAGYAGSVKVTDPEGNSDTMPFAFGPCGNGQVP